MVSMKWHSVRWAVPTVFFIATPRVTSHGDAESQDTEGAGEAPDFTRP